MIEDFQVYKSYSPEFIKEALDDFKRIMFNGGEIEELEAGLRCLDFLTRGSELTPDLEMFIEAAESEARMRIALMAEQEAMERTEKEVFDNAFRTIKNLNTGIKSIQKMIEVGVDPDYVYDYVQKMCAERRVAR